MEYCPIKIVEVDVGFHMKQYAWLIFAVLFTWFMVDSGSRWLCEAILM